MSTNRQLKIDDAKADVTHAIRRAMKVYRHGTWSNKVIPDNVYSPDEFIVDVIADVLHYAEHLGHNPDELVARGMAHYLTESNQAKE